jgi:hypothetical protein
LSQRSARDSDFATALAGREPEESDHIAAAEFTHYEIQEI